MVSGSGLQRKAFMYAQRLGKRLMSDQSDGLREAQSKKLCDLLGVEIDCYTWKGAVVHDPTLGVEPVLIPRWLVRRIIRLRPPLQELSEMDQYENGLIHNHYLDMIYDPKN
jgi:hypothetical protein